MIFILTTRSKVTNWMSQRTMKNACCLSVFILHQSIYSNLWSAIIYIWQNQLLGCRFWKVKIKYSNKGKHIKLWKSSSFKSAHVQKHKPILLWHYANFLLDLIIRQNINSTQKLTKTIQEKINDEFSLLRRNRTLTERVVMLMTRSMKL